MTLARSADERSDDSFLMTKKPARIAEMMASGLNRGRLES